jgi:hypothetical protein
MKNLHNLITYAWTAHSQYPTKDSKSYRKWDGMTPYATHVVWCAMTLLTETTLTEEVRGRGAEALLLHDVLEDTTSPLPENISDGVEHLVKEMTFPSNEVEMAEIWSKSKEVKLLKLYDKISNLLDGVWMDAGKSLHYAEYAQKLLGEVEQVYGQLNIVKIAKSILSNLPKKEVHSEGDPNSEEFLFRDERELGEKMDPNSGWSKFWDRA